LIVMPAAPFSSLPRPLLFGHRGASAEAPENTLLAFELAVAAGVDVLEMDVHLSRDGVVVVHHDALLDRTTNGSGLLKSYDAAQLQQLDAGYHFRDAAGEHAYRGKPLRIPRLVEVLEAFPKVGFNIEVKQREPPMIEAVLAELSRAGPRETLLAAADAEIMRELEAARPGVPLGLSASQCWRVWWRSMLGQAPNEFGGRALQVPPRYLGVLPIVPPRVVRAAHAAGIEVHLWTIDHPDAVSHWLSQGIDGIMSDDPRRVVDVIRAARAGCCGPGVSWESG
jgi:glycerophosphoryl diester phosphodiesterase